MLRVLCLALGCWLLGANCAAAAAACQPTGRQHLVNPGDDWSNLAQELKPGDEVLLMPGVHRPAVLDNVRGSPDRPITIRSLNTEHPATIDAVAGQTAAARGRFGLQLRGMRYVIIQDLTITGATLHGIEATGPIDDGDLVTSTSPNVTLRNVHIERIGPIGRRNGALLTGHHKVVIEHSTFKGWGGSAVELVACSNVTIDNCTFEGLPDYSQMNAVQMRAGSDQVHIRNCTMLDVGVTAVALGGRSAPEEFRNGSSDDRQSPMAEASNVRVSGNLIRAGHSGVAFINCERCIVQGNTIIRPQRWVYLILDRQKPHLHATRRSSFAGNLIHWEPGDVRQFSYITNGIPASGLTLEQNLWWSSDLAERLGQLEKPAGTTSMPQVTDVDPRLDEQFYPAEPRARMFGRDKP